MSAEQDALILKFRARDIISMIAQRGRQLEKDKRLSFYQEYNKIRFQIIKLIKNFKNKKRFLIPALDKKDFFLGTCLIVS